eukprot:2591173-Pyramimonas_sp.AAC.1
MADLRVWSPALGELSMASSRLLIGSSQKLWPRMAMSPPARARCRTRSCSFVYLCTAAADLQRPRRLVASRVKPHST